MKKIFNILGYIVIALSIFIGGWQLSSWMRGDIIQVHEIIKNDTIFLLEKLPKIIQHDKIVFHEKIVHRIDTVFRTNIIEKTEYIYIHDTLLTTPLPLRFADIKKSNLMKPIKTQLFEGYWKKNRIAPNPQLMEQREWWEDLLLITLSGYMTYQITKCTDKK